MDTKVKVVADATTELVINQSANPIFGYVRVVQNRVVIDDNGFMKRKEFSALIHGLIEDLQSVGYYNGQELPGTIVAEESLDPFNKKDPSKSIKKAGETNVACTLGGFPIHRRTKYTTKANAEDILISHDNKAEVKAAYASNEASKAKTKAMQPNAEFDTEAEGFNL
jgi:hypothetical protein